MTDIKSERIISKKNQAMKEHHLKNQNRFIIYVDNGKNGLDVYLSTGSETYYIATRRRNSMLWERLRGGVSIGELQRLKPRQSRSEQMYYERTRHLLSVVDEFIDYEILEAS